MNVGMALSLSGFCMLAAVGSVVPFPESYCLDEGNTTLRFIQGFGGVAYL